MPNSGCGPGGIEIHGKITVNGSPIKEAQIEFIPMQSTGGDQVGTVVADDAYSLETPSN